jgi:hypothetical protein
VRTAQFKVQDALNAESERYKHDQENLAEVIDELTKAVAEGRDASELRNRAMTALTSGVVHSFSLYANKASLEYQDQRPEMVASFIGSEILGFLLEMRDFLDVINNPSVIGACMTSTQPLQITHASLGHIERCLLALAPRLDSEGREQLQREAVKLGADPVFAFVGRVTPSPAAIGPIDR